jgi:hypothetical protein
MCAAPFDPADTVALGRLEHAFPKGWILIGKSHDEIAEAGRRGAHASPKSTRSWTARRFRPRPTKSRRQRLKRSRNLTPEAVAAFNHTILTRDMSAEMAGERRERFGIADSTFAHAVSLNDLDDWDQAHRRLTSSATPSPVGRETDLLRSQPG